MGAAVPTPEFPPAWATPTPEFPPAWAVPAATVAGGLRSGPATAGSRGRVAGALVWWLMRRVGTRRWRVRGRRASAAPAGLEGAAAAELGCGEDGRRRLATTGQGGPRPANSGHGWPQPSIGWPRRQLATEGHDLASLIVNIAGLASPWWWGQGVGWCLLVASRWCFRRRRASSSGGDAEETGAVSGVRQAGC
jgi:hypothetical protein